MQRLATGAGASMKAVSLGPAVLPSARQFREGLPGRGRVNPPGTPSVGAITTAARRSAERLRRKPETKTRQGAKCTMNENEKQEDGESYGRSIGSSFSGSMTSLWSSVEVLHAMPFERREQLAAMIKTLNVGDA